MNRPQAIVLFFIFVQLAACAQQELKSMNNIAKQAQLQATTEAQLPEELSERAEISLNQGRQEGLDFFSPLHLQYATQKLNQAKSHAKQSATLLANQARLEAIELIKQGLKNKQDVQSHLSEALAHKDMIENLNAAQLFPAEYANIMADFATLVQYIEQSEPGKALNEEPTLRKKMYRLEIDALIHKHLNEAQDLLTKAENADAEQYAPFSYLNAAHKIAATENYIRTNYRDRKGIKQAADTALLLTKKTVFTAQDSQRIANFEEQQIEDYILDLQKNLSELNALGGGQEFVPQTISQSLALLRAQVQSMKQTLATLTQNNAVLNQELAKFKTQVQPSRQHYEGKAETISVLQTLSPQAVKGGAAPNDEQVINEDEESFDSIEFATP